MTEKKLSRAEIGNRIKGLCEDGNVNKLARKLNVSSSFLHEIVKGIKKPSVEVLRAIADKLSINLNWLLTGEGPKHWGDEHLQDKQVFQKQSDHMLGAIVAVCSELSTKGKGDVLVKAEELRLAETTASKKVSAAHPKQSGERYPR